MSAVAAAVFLALAVHLFYVYETRHDPTLSLPLVDAAYYHQQASGQTAPDLDEPYWQPPLFVWWLRGVYAVTGPYPGRVRVVHSLLTALTALLTALLARQLLGWRLAWLPPLLVALCAPLLFVSAQLLPAALGSVALLAMVLAGGRFLQEGAPRYGFLAGLTAGLGALVLANMLLLLPLLLGWTALGAAVRERRRALAAVTCGMLLAIAPVTARNYVASGYFVPVSINGGINLYLGNNPEYPSSIWIRPGLDWDRLLLMPFDHGATDSVEADRFFIARAVRFWVTQPVRAARVMLHKGLVLLNGREVPRNLDIYTARGDSRVLRVLLGGVRRGWWPNGILLPLAVTGLVAALCGAWGRNGRWIGSVVLVYCASIVVVFVTSRYRAPVLPLLYILAGAAVLHLYAVARNGTWRRRTLTAAVLLAALAAAQVPAGHVAPFSFQAEHKLLAASALSVRGKAEAAGSLFAEAILLNPESAEAWFGLGTVYGLMGHHDSALECYHACLLRRPDHDGALVNMGVEKLRRGDISGARHYFNSARLFNARNARAWQGAGICAMHEGDNEEAVNLLQQAVALAPADAETRHALGGAYWNNNEHAQAGDALRTAVELRPGYPRYINTLKAWEAAPQ